jgi:hypothetical protein
MRSLTAAVLALALLFPAFAGARGPSTPAERRRAIETTRRLERDPLAKRASADRRWLLEWIVAIPDVNVLQCAGPLDALAEEGAPHGRILYVQAVFGMARYLIENPGKQDDWVAVQTAGIESALRAYEAILRAEPRSHVAALDRLVATRKAGKLRALVEEEVRCEDTSETI